MNVFISWSGDSSKKFAETLNEWLPMVIQAIKPFYSPEDIKKGEFWTGRIKDELKSNTTGIICIAQNNQNAPWILFEAGALANSIGKSKVYPLLFDMEITELKPPLSLFNASVFNKEEIRKILKSINSDLDDKLEEKRIDKLFDALWSEFEGKIEKIISESKDKGHKKESSRTVDDMIKEVLILQRENITRNDSIYSQMFHDILNMVNQLQASFEKNVKYLMHDNRIKSKPPKVSLYLFVQDLIRPILEPADYENLFIYGKEHELIDSFNTKYLKNINENSLYVLSDLGIIDKNNSMDLNGLRKLKAILDPF
jgi:hypothetical protein